MVYRGADKSLARPTSRCILFYGENISFDASLVIYINSTNIPAIMIINKIYEHQNLLSLQLVSFLVGAKGLSAPMYKLPTGIQLVKIGHGLFLHQLIAASFQITQSVLSKGQSIIREISKVVALQASLTRQIQRQMHVWDN